MNGAAGKHNGMPKYVADDERMAEHEKRDPPFHAG
jgi:hypothetical protein